MMDKKKTGNDYRLQLAVLAGIGIILLCILGFMGAETWIQYRDALINAQKDQMLLTVETLSRDMSDAFEDKAADLSAMSRTVEKLDQEGRGRLYLDFLESRSDYVDNLIELDIEGNSVWACAQEKFTRIYAAYHVDEDTLFEEAMNDEGEIRLLLTRRFSGGSICMVLDAAAYFERISNVTIGTNGYFLVKDQDGIILMYPTENQLGLDVIEGRRELFPEADLTSLEEMLKDQEAGHTDTAEYYSYWWSDPALPRVRKIAAYAPVRLMDGFLIIPAVMDYSDIYNPILGGFRGIIAIMSLAGLIIPAVLIIWFLLLRQSRRDQEEIHYLRELNKVLEETHRTEEALEQKQRLQIMGAVTGGIAHEFNNLLTPIMGYADMLMLELPEDSEAYDNAKEIFSASEKARDIIRQISQMSRKNMETTYHYIDGREFLTRCLKMVRSMTPANVRIEEDISLGGAGFLGNKTQMSQVMLNLTLNAFQAIGRESGGVVRVEGRQVSREVLQRRGLDTNGIWENYIRIRVVDNGCGMDKMTMEQIFTPFFTTRENGTGFGLAIAESMITSHRGYITVDSTPGKGSVFTVYLPAAKKADEERLHSAAASRGYEDGSHKILVVDDNVKILQELAGEFGKIGVNIKTCVNTGEAEEQLSRHHYHVLLIDNELSRAGGDNTGIDFAMSIREKYNGLLIIVMADKIRKEIVEARQEGIINAYLEKPVSVQELLETMQNTSSEIL